MDIDTLFLKSQTYRRELDRKKAELAPTEFTWYPYGTLDNFYLLSQLLSAEHRDFLTGKETAPIIDIGAADGDIAFFLESLGYRVHIADFPPTNYNSCRGVRLLKQALNSQVEILETDLDAQFVLPERHYELAFFLGILYHLKNPFMALECLAKCAEYAFISTRITRYNTAPGNEGVSVNRKRIELTHAPVAYLVDADETNGDATNFWMFSEIGLRRILHRSGWDVLDFKTFGNTQQSDPATADGDERAFCFVRSRYF